MREIQEYLGVSVFFNNDMYDDRKYTQNYKVIFSDKTIIYAHTLSKDSYESIAKAVKLRWPDKEIVEIIYQ